MRDAPQLVVRWEATLLGLMKRTNSLPKSVRFTLAQRIDTQAIEVLERLVTARYASGEACGHELAGADGALTRLRILLRLAHRLGHLSHGAYEQVMRECDESGRMLGGWRRALVEAA